MGLGLAEGGPQGVTGLLHHPRVLQDLLQGNAVLGPDPQAGLDQVGAVGGHLAAELELGVADLVVGLEGNVALDHVEEEDAEGPDGGGVAVVPGTPDPLRRGVDTGTIELGVGLLLEEAAGPKVDEADAAGLGVDQKVLVLDVPMDDPLGVAGQHGGHHLTEEVGGETLVKSSLLGDIVKQVLAVGGALQDVDVGVGPLIVVNELDHPGH